MTIEALEGITDDELFSEAQIEEPANEPEPEAEQPRDEEGKFAKVEADEPATTAEPEPARAEEEVAQIPSWRAREINEERRAAIAERDAIKAERDRLAQENQDFQRRMKASEKPQEKPEPIDPLMDPVGYQKHLESTFEERLQNQHREFDLRLTRQANPETFDKAYAEAQQAIQSGDIEIRQKMQNTSTPGETLLNWYRQRTVQREVGADPEAYFNKRFEAFLADPANQAKVLERIRGEASTAPAGGRPATSLPPSLTRATNASANSADDNDVSDEGLFNYATR